jgi:hypothetical protein
MSSNLPVETTVSVPPPETKHSRAFWATLEILAILIWMFAICKLFVFDIDTQIFESYFPESRWLLNYKSLFFLGSVTAWLWIMGVKFGLFLICFLILYPLFFFLWRIPAFVLRRKSWALAFAALNFTIEFFRSFRRNATLAVLLASCLVVSITSNDHGLLYAAIAVMLMIMALLYYLTFKSAFTPARIYQLYSRALPPIRGYFAKNNLLEGPLKELPPTEWNEDQRKVWADKIQVPILANRFYLFLARKFRDYQKSSIPFIHNIAIIVMLFVVTVVVFAAVNFSVYKIDASSFDVTKTNFFSFVWYSFNTFVFNFVKEVSPESSLAKALWMSEAFLALFLVAIILAMYLSIRSQRITNQVDAMIETLENESAELELFIKREYQITSIDEAVAELDRVKAGLVKMMLWLTRNMR